MNFNLNIFIDLFQLIIYNFYLIFLYIFSWLNIEKKITKNKYKLL